MSNKQCAKCGHQFKDGDAHDIYNGHAVCKTECIGNFEDPYLTDLEKTMAANEEVVGVSEENYTDILNAWLHWKKIDVAKWEDKELREIECEFLSNIEGIIINNGKLKHQLAVAVDTLIMIAVDVGVGTYSPSYLAKQAIEEIKDYEKQTEGKSNE